MAANRLEQKKNRKLARDREAAEREVTGLTASLKEREKLDRELDLKLKQSQQDLQLQQKLLK